MVALEAARSGGRLKLRSCYEWPLSEGLVVDGEIVDVDLLARELKAFANEYKLRGKSVYIAVSNQKVIVRNIEMPEMTEGELKGAIEFQAQDYIPIPVDEVVLDFQVLGRSVNPEGASRQEVILVAGQKTMIGMFCGAIKQAGLKVAGIDVCSMALVRALVPSRPFLADTDQGGVCRAIADISSSVSTLVVAVEGVPKFTRVINFSSDRFARNLSEQRGIPADDAYSLAQRVGLAGPLAADSELYAEDVVAQIQQSLGEVALELSDEIRRSLHYYQGQESATPVTELILSGRGALVRNLDAHLTDALNMPVSIRRSRTPILRSWLRICRWLSASSCPRKNRMARRINLVPTAERARTATNLGMLGVVALAIVVVGAVGLGYYVFKNNLNDRKAELVVLQQDTQVLQAQVAALSKYDSLASELQRVETTVQEIYAGRTLVSDILDSLSLVLPENVWLQSLSLTTADPGLALTGEGAAGDNSISLSGKTYTFEDVAELLVRLQLIPAFANIDLQSATGSSGAEQGAVDVKSFSLGARVKPPSGEALLPVSQVEVEGL
jgi:type IV pilus assembly protein PilM